jgi:hypothetical protein
MRAFLIFSCSGLALFVAAVLGLLVYLRLDNDALSEPPRVAASETPNGTSKAFFEKVGRLVLSYYPNAEITIGEKGMSFRFNTRKFWIHEPDLGGYWQDPWEEEGPEKGGICGSLTLVPGDTRHVQFPGGTRDKRYFIFHWNTRASERLNHYIKYRLSCPSDVPAQFVHEFMQLAYDFENHIGRIELNGRGEGNLANDWTGESR